MSENHFTLFIKVMMLLTKANLKSLPKIGATEKLELADHVLQVKLFCPWSSWAWYLCEYDAEAKIAFGYVKGFENEWGDFAVWELEEIVGPMGLKIERDMYFKPIKFSELKE